MSFTSASARPNPGEPKGIYYPEPAGAEKKPLVMTVGGYDSTMEELYFMLKQAGARSRLLGQTLI
jgi:hypothetical protein